MNTKKISSENETSNGILGAVSCRYKTLDEVITWVRYYTPFAVKPTKKAKTTYVSPFTSENAYRIVTEEIAKAIFNGS